MPGLAQRFSLMLGLAQRFSLSLAAAAALATGSCSPPDESPWPARNYGGTWIARIEGVLENDCPAPAFAEDESLTLVVAQDRENRVRLDLPPLVSLRGAFEGDLLEVRAAVVIPGTLGVVPGADSLRYGMKLEFEGEEFRGEYSVEQPALGQRIEACHQVFELEGRLAAEG